MTTIPLGYQIGTGRLIEIPLRHTGVFGQTQESGKTTTLEGLITRSGLPAVAYVTKRGESSFHVSKPIPPFFRERTDWPFVAAILEATLSEKLKFQRAWIMKLCKAHRGKKGNWEVPRSLADVQRNVEIALETATGLNESVYTELDEYLKMILPEITRLPYSTELRLQPGVNVMDLCAYSFPMQSLVVRSVIEWIHRHETGVITVIPEAWKFAPKQRGSPVRLAAEELIREGGALKNFIWLDSQDIAGVADVLLRQVGVWIFGKQRATHEIERTMKLIPGDLKARPRASEIATLSKGQFIACWEREMFKVYVQPAWMTAAHAEAIARGEESVESAREILHHFDVEHPQSKSEIRNQKSEIRTTEGGMDWQKKYEEENQKNTRLEIENKQLREELTVQGFVATVQGFVASKAADAADAALEADRIQTYPIANIPAVKPVPLGSVDPSGFDPLYRQFVARLKNDRQIIALLFEKPTIDVGITRPVLSLDGSTLRGRLAYMVARGFFKDVKNGQSAFNELQRTGFRCAKPNVYRELDGLAALGFVTKEEGGYLEVAEMKIRITEAKTNG